MWNPRRLLLALILGQALIQAHAADPSVGAIVGLVTSPSGAPVAHATVTALRADGGAIRATVSASDGVYSFGDLPPGVWNITAQVSGAPEASAPALAVIGMMGYNRFWFDHDLYAVTIGGGFMNNPGRYLALLPPINGATALSGTPYFTENPGQKLYQWDTQLNFQYMPKPWITWWTELTFRHSDVPYWTGTAGVTPPLGNTGAPSSYVCNNGSVIGADNCANEGGVWFPDLRTREVVWGAGLMVKF